MRAKTAGLWRQAFAKTSADRHVKKLRTLYLSFAVNFPERFFSASFAIPF